MSSLTNFIMSHLNDYFIVSIQLTEIFFISSQKSHIFMIFFSLYNIIMIQQQLGQKINHIKQASNFEQRLIQSIFIIMSMKRKAQADYKQSLQTINKQLQRYIVSESGFLTQIIKSFQSYVQVMYQNQKILIQGYDNQILTFLQNIKKSKFEQSLIEKVKFVDSRVKQCQEKIRNYKKLIRGNQQQLELVQSQVKLKSRLSELPQQEKKKFADRYNDATKLKQQNQQSLQQYVNSMMDITMLHNQTLEELSNYQKFHLQQRANQVFDNFMRAFVLEVSFIRSLQFDVGIILQKIKQKQQQHRKLAIQSLRARMKREDSKVKQFIWNTYKNWTTTTFQINEPYINNRIKDKWKRVCEYYNQAH